MENNHYGVESSIAGRNQFFMKVYAWMFGGLAISALVAYLFSTVPALYSAFFNFMVMTRGYGMWVIFIAQLILVFVMRPNYEELGRPIRYIVSYCLYAALTGFTFFIVTQVYELGSIVQAFISTCALFAGLSIVGFTTKKDLTSFGRQAFQIRNKARALSVLLFLQGSDCFPIWLPLYEAKPMPSHSVYGTALFSCLQHGDSGNVSDLPDNFQS